MRNSILSRYNSHLKLLQLGKMKNTFIQSKRLGEVFFRPLESWAFRLVRYYPKTVHIFRAVNVYIFYGFELKLITQKKHSGASCI